ncbi:hypothetical protein MNV49_006873 [Pseudohyphozyma bogoriensis]|nr:hypothetical protein MNV49_006873 [Pseudohyphozyma bogoriensis]
MTLPHSHASTSAATSRTVSPAASDLTLANPSWADPKSLDETLAEARKRKEDEDAILAEGEEVEREMAAYGGDVPDDEVRVRRSSRKHSRSRSELDDGDLSLNDTERVRSQTGEEVEVKKDAVDPNKVAWNGPDDPENPQNFSKAKKWVITLIVSILTVNVTLASSAPSAATEVMAAEFGASEEVTLLTTSLFLCGYILGPVLFGPASETFGRRDVFTVTGVLYTIFLGPTLGPIVGGFLTDSYLGWRWIFWIMAIFSAFCTALGFFFLPETFAPVLLARRAKAMRKAEPEKNRELYADLERADFSVKGLITRTLERPFKMLSVEPILILVTIYLSIVYGLLYALFSMFPIIWAEIRGFSLGISGLAFLGVTIGTLSGSAVNLYLSRHYPVLVPKWHGHPPPEQRLHGAMVAGPFLLIGIFMLGWTGNYKSVPWYVPDIAAIFVGFSFNLVFTSFLSYLVEVYLMYAASALAANTIIRSAVAAAFPLFINQMIKGMHVNWALTLWGCIAILLVPSPFIFYKYGPRIRQGSSFAPCLDLHMKPIVEHEQLT